MRELERPLTEAAEYGRKHQFRIAQPATEFEPAQPIVPPAHYLLIIWRQRWKIAGFVATCMLVTYLISGRLTPVFEASAKIDVDRSIPAGIVGQEATQSTGGEDDDAFMATQMELIQSDAVLRPVAGRFNLLRKERQLDKLQSGDVRRRTDAPVYLRQLKVTRPIGTYILEISYRSPDPQLAADVANAVAQSYLEHTFDIRLKNTGALSNYMEKQLDELRAKVERSSEALSKFEQEMGVINPEDKTNILSARLLQLNQEYTAAQSDRVRKEAAYIAAQSGTMASAMISTQGDELNRLQDRLNQAKQNLADVASIYGPNNDEYRKVASDLAEVERQFEEARNNVGQRLDAQYREALNREDMLRKEVNDTKSEYDRLNSRSFEYQQLKRDAEADKALYGDLERRIREGRINAGFQNGAIRIADLARPPDGPVFPRTRLNLLLAFAASLILAICAAIVGDVLDNTIRDPEQVARALDTSVLGTLPSVKEMRQLTAPAPNLVDITLVEEHGKSPAAKKLIRYRAEDAAKRKKRKTEIAIRTNEDGISSYEEAIRSLRHSILLPDFDRAVRSLLVTSAVAAEGKSTAIVHLAIAHSEQGKRTLIIDSDLRRPSIHKKLNLNGAVGLSNVLLGEFGWKETIVNNERWPNLDVLPAGTASRRASDLVGSMMMDILDEAGKEYDLILVDAPPLLGFAEAMQVARSVDGVVVMARAGQTSRKAVAIVLATLKRVRANILGMVLNEVDKTNSDGFYYYSDYRKYYGGRLDTDG